ncbi:MAG TPA: Asd/ArgC dimerization domain-containing protein [Gaiellaceae bacterium]|nr:Asd/ArgC dimerization domain-containing protein [Gaiellaceae bacterium]
MRTTDARIGVVGATGVVGAVTLELLAERRCSDVRAYASSRSAGSEVHYGGGSLRVEEATPERLAADGLDLCFFSVGTGPSSELVPPTAEAGTTCIDKSDAFRLAEGIPLVVAGVNDEAIDDGPIIANPNCSAIQLSCLLKPLHEAAGLRRVRLATYQSMSGAGDPGVERLRDVAPMQADLAMDWELEDDEFSEESKLRAETQKILGLPDLAVQATCIRIPVLVGHGQAIWVETEEPLAPDQARTILGSAPHVALEDFATPGTAAGRDEVLVGRIRRGSEPNELALWAVNDNLRKGAALNALQVAELILDRSAPRAGARTHAASAPI